MSRWDGGRGDLGESAGDGLSYSAPHVEAPDPDIIMRRFRDLGKDHDPSDASAGQVDPMPG